MLALVAWVLVSSHVPPGPTVKTIFRYGGNVVGDEVVAEPVAFVGRAPQFASAGVDGNAHGIAYAPRIDARRGAVRGELQNVGAVKFRRVAVRVVVVGVRTDGDKHPAAIVGKGDVASPVAATAQESASGNFFYHRLRTGAGLQIAILIREAYYRIGVSYVDPFRFRAGRIEVDAERLVESGGENLCLLRAAIRSDATENLNLTGAAFGQEKIAIGRGPNQAREIESAGVELHS